MHAPERHDFAQEMPPESLKMTLDEFLANDLEGYEYIKGELVPMPPRTMEHGEISVNIIVPLDSHVRANQLGRVYTAATTFKLGERAVKPDVAFVSKERLPANRRQNSPVPPDLAVEISSPSDSLMRVSEKVQAYLDAGTQMVWVIDPVLQTVAVYRPDRDFKLLTLGDTLTGEDVVEGFSCPVAQIFEWQILSS